MKIPTSALFAGVGTHDLDSMMSCLSAKERNYKKNEFIFHTGDKVTQIGMVLEGTVHMMKEDIWGNVMILGEACPGDLFGEVYSCAGSKEFTIPFNRQQLAEYLSVDRSALSAELGKMRDEGMLEFWKNQFKLK